MRIKLDSDRIFWFIKFSEKQEYLTNIQQGNLYMNNGEYFINREKQDGIQGLGDENELSAVLNNVELKFYDSETNEFLVDGEAQRLSFNYDYTLTKPIFCLTYIDHESLNIIEVNEDSVECQMDFSGESIEKIIEDFGEYALLISPKLFLEKLRKALKEQNIESMAQKVNYEDFSINSKKRLDEYYEHNPSLFFKKDHSFKYQQEFRVVLTNIDSEEPYILNIGDISEFSYIVPTRRLFSDEIVFTVSDRLTVN